MEMAGRGHIKAVKNGQMELNEVELKQIMELQRAEAEIQSRYQMLARLIEGRLGLDEGELGRDYQIEGAKVVKVEAGEAQVSDN
jgi:hypothetical protein